MSPKYTIFSLGILEGAIGRLLLPAGELPATEAILAQAAELASAAIRRDFERIDASTAGGRAYLACGARGIRGEVADGFPSIRHIALPVYREARASGKNKNDAGVLTLLHLIANVYDTNLYKRGGEEGLRYAQDLARTLLASGAPTVDEVRRMDIALTQRNLSPGGCADLLAVTYFLTQLEDVQGDA